MKKSLLGILAVLMVFALALTGCGQQGEQNAGATGSEGQNSTTAADDGKNEGEVTTEPDGSDDVGGEADNRNPEMRDGKYVYEVDGTEILCKTNIWDYEGRLDALLGAPMNKNSEDFLELRYLNVLGFYGQGGRFVEIIIRYYQDGFATDEPDGPTTPIDLVIMSAYFLEQCQENVDNDYLYVFPNAGDGVYRIYE